MCDYPVGFETFWGIPTKGYIVTKLPEKSGDDTSGKSDLYTIRRKCCGVVTTLQCSSIAKNVRTETGAYCRSCTRRRVAAGVTNPAEEVSLLERLGTHPELEHIPKDILNLAMSTRWV